jgi:lysophospholipase L1-like esterase
MKKRTGFNWLVCVALLSGFAFISVNENRFNSTYQFTALYPFIRKDKNLITRTTPAGLHHFYLSLDSLSKGTRKRVNVVHIGDSHIQADMFSGKVREHFYKDSLTGNAGRGFVFPYSAVRTNNPVNIKVAYTGQWTGCRNVEKSKSCNWGLSGITATTSDSSATFTINPNTNPEYIYPVSRVKIFYDVADTSFFKVKLLTEEDRIISAKISNKGFAEFLLKAPLDQITVAFEKSDSSQTRFTLQGVSLESDSRGMQYHAVGINGAEVASFLRNTLEPNMQVLNPDLVIISLGTNDAYMADFDEKAFKRNYGTLIQRIKKASPKASILLTTPGDCYRDRKYTNYNNAKATEQIMDLAEETGCGVWNFYEVMGGLRSINQWHANGLASKDKIHLTKKGYTLQGDLLYEALKNDYLKYMSKHSKITVSNEE